MLKHIQASLQVAQSVLNDFFENQNNLDLISRVIEQLVLTFNNKSKVISCGNGGSMCDAMHFAEELTGRFRKERPALPAVAISDPSHISCTANDYGYEFIFSRYIEAWGNPGDTLLAISTSGNSPNVVNAVKTAKQNRMFVIGLLGKDGGVLEEIVDIPIVINHSTSDRIQELHIKIIHLVVEGVERKLFPENYS